MPAGYDYSLDGKAVSILLVCSAREQRSLVDAIEKLARYPGVRGDYSFLTEDGRTNEVLDLGDFVVTYWTDHAVRVVRILVIERV